MEEKIRNSRKQSASKKEEEGGYTSDTKIVCRKKIKYEDVNTIIASKKLEEYGIYLVTVRLDDKSRDDVSGIFFFKPEDKILKVRMLVDKVVVACDAMVAKLDASGRIEGNYCASKECIDDKATLASLGFLCGRIDLSVGFP